MNFRVKLFGSFSQMLKQFDEEVDKFKNIQITPSSKINDILNIGKDLGILLGVNYAIFSFKEETSKTSKSRIKTTVASSMPNLIIPDLPDEVQDTVSAKGIRTISNSTIKSGAGRYEGVKDIIHRNLDARGVPREFANIPMIESVYQVGLKSHAGAKGPWQIMPNTGAEWGLKTDEDYNDWNKSSLAAAKELMRDYKILHNWHLVVMAYNTGAGNVQKAIRKAGLRVPTTENNVTFSQRDVWRIWKSFDLVADDPDIKYSRDSAKQVQEYYIRFLTASGQHPIAPKEEEKDTGFLYQVSSLCVGTKSVNKQ